jgi:hypothetical protein
MNVERATPAFTFVRRESCSYTLDSAKDCYGNPAVLDERSPMKAKTRLRPPESVSLQGNAIPIDPELYFRQIVCAITQKFRLRVARSTISLCIPIRPTTRTFSHFHVRTNLVGSMQLPDIAPAIKVSARPTGVDVFIISSRWPVA